MKHLTLLLAVSLFHFPAPSQTSFADSAALWFEDIKQVTRQHRSLWNYDLYAPILLVDPNTREVFSNAADSTGVLTQSGTVFTGILPTNINIANTALHWGGVHWAMVMLPVPVDRNARNHLLSHELFHRAQKELGFFSSNPENNHLDKKDGRIYLRLELEALKKAVLSPTRNELKKHIEHALYFRKERQAIFPGADTTENMLELNEGLSEFTGFMMSGRESYDARKYLSGRLSAFISGTSFIRSFAYETIPVYGFLLNPDKKGWQREIRQNTNLTEFFNAAFQVPPSNRRRTQIASIAKDYNYDQVLAEETAREEKFQQQFAIYKALFIDSAHVEIPLIKMNMSFDYTLQFSMDTLGMIYPSIRITDNWGVLEASQGVLINAGWSQANVSLPTSIEGSSITGEGWTLKLNEGYVFQKNDESGNYIVKKEGD